MEPDDEIRITIANKDLISVPTHPVLGVIWIIHDTEYVLQTITNSLSTLEYKFMKYSKFKELNEVN